MDENTFWSVVWKVIGVVASIVAVSIASCSANTNYQTRKAIEKGADPLLVSCAFGREGSMTTCAIIGARDRK